jgi:hypothetical protein
MTIQFKKIIGARSLMVVLGILPAFALATSGKASTMPLLAQASSQTTQANGLSSNQSKKGWVFNYNTYVEYEYTKRSNQDFYDVDLAGGLSLQNKGFYLAYNGEYNMPNTDENYWEHEFDTGYVLKPSSHLLLGLSASYDRQDPTDYSKNDTTVEGGVSWYGLGLYYNSENDDHDVSHTTSFEYQHNYGNNYLMAGYSRKKYTDDNSSGDYLTVGYERSLTSHYRVGFNFTQVRVPGSSDINSFTVGLYRGLDFKGLAHAFRHYM